MRLLVAAALVLGAAPALAQDLPEDYDVFEVDTLDAPLRFEIERDEDGAVIFRRGDGEDEVFRFQLPDPEMLGRFGEDMEALRHRFLFREHLDDGDGPAALFLRGLSGEPGVSPETRERMRQLEREARAAPASLAAPSGKKPMSGSTPSSASCSRSAARPGASGRPTSASGPPSSKPRPPSSKTPSATVRLGARR